MKKLLTATALILGSMTAQALPNPTAVIRENLEVKSIIQAIESNRSLRCEQITFKNTKFGKAGSVVSTISCNQYDEQNEPMANVHFIEITGHLYSGTEFQLSSVKITAAE